MPMNTRANGKALFLLETRRFFKGKKLVYLIVFFLLLQIMGFIGAKNYIQSRVMAGEFQKAEKIMFGELDNYSQYNIQGLKFLFIPSGISSLFNNYNFCRELTARINSVVTLDISGNIKGKELALRNGKEYLDFAGIFLIFAGLFALALGYEIPMHKEYLKFLTGDTSPGMVFGYMALFRYLLMISVFVFMLGFQLLILKFMGIGLTGADWLGILHFLPVAALAVLFFFLSGTAMGVIRSRSNGFVKLLAAWFILVFLLPGVLYLIAWEGCDTKYNSYRVDVEKLTIAADFEAKSRKESGDFDRGKMEVARKVIQDYLSNYYPKIREIELKYRDYLSGRIRGYMRGSLCLPTTFYNMVCREVSSGGYGSYLEFYDYLIRNHEAFVRFWVQHVFYGDPYAMESFIQGDENMFRGESRKPPYFLAGMAVNLGYCLVLYMFSLAGFKRYLRNYEDKAPFKKKEPVFPLASKRINTYFTDRPGLRDYLYMVFTGNLHKCKGVGHTLAVTLDGKEVKGDGNTPGFRYICSPGEIPGEIVGGDFLDFELTRNRVPVKERKEIKASVAVEVLGKSFGKMTLEEKLEVLAAVLPVMRGEVFLFYHTCWGLTRDFYILFKNRLKLLTEKGAAIIYLNPETSVMDIRKKRNRDIIELKHWVELLESLEGESTEENNDDE